MDSRARAVRTPIALGRVIHQPEAPASKSTRTRTTPTHVLDVDGGFSLRSIRRSSRDGLGLLINRFRKKKPVLGSRVNSDVVTNRAAVWNATRALSVRL